ncbi:hypothetical protein T492DRAFT_871122, partial [Pavlovales sp. CCMP2436]
MAIGRLPKWPPANSALESSAHPDEDAHGEWLEAVADARREPGEGHFRYYPTPADESERRTADERPAGGSDPAVGRVAPDRSSQDRASTTSYAGAKDLSSSELVRAYNPSRGGGPIRGREQQVLRARDAGEVKGGGERIVHLGRGLRPIAENTLSHKYGFAGVQAYHPAPKQPERNSVGFLGRRSITPNSRGFSSETDNERSGRAKSVPAGRVRAEPEFSASERPSDAEGAQAGYADSRHENGHSEERREAAGTRGGQYTTDARYSDSQIRYEDGRYEERQEGAMVIGGEAGGSYGGK